MIGASPVITIHRLLTIKPVQTKPRYEIVGDGAPASWAISETHAMKSMLETLRCWRGEPGLALNGMVLIR